MMGGLFTWLIVGVVIYLLLFRRGGMGGLMGCFRGHNHHAKDYYRNAWPHDHRPEGSSSEDRWPRAQEDIIDLKKEDYHVTNR